MKSWFLETFLPMWAKETVLTENRSLRKENEQLRCRVRQLEFYIRGLHRGSRYQIKTTAVGRSAFDSPQLKNQGGKGWTS